jgi:hypothetical protein
MARVSTSRVSMGAEWRGGRTITSGNRRLLLTLVMPGLVPGIHVFRSISKKDVDGRVKPGHDENDSFSEPLESPAK